MIGLVLLHTILNKPIPVSGFVPDTSHDQVDLLDTDGIYEEITDADCTAFKQAIGNWC